MLNYADETPLHLAAREGKILMVEYYISNLADRVHLDGTMIDGWSAFMYAAINGYILTVDILHKAKVNIDRQDKFGRTALHWAARYANKPMAKKLCDIGCDKDIRELEGFTASELAKHYQHYEVATIITQTRPLKPIMKGARRL